MNVGKRLCVCVWARFVIAQNGIEWNENENENETNWNATNNGKHIGVFSLQNVLYTIHNRLCYKYRIYYFSNNRCNELKMRDN